MLTNQPISVSNLKPIVAAFNQEKALVGAFSVIVKTDGSFEALITIISLHQPGPVQHLQVAY